MKKIRYGVVGCGQRFQHLVKLLARYDSVTLTACWDPEARNSEKLFAVGAPGQPFQAYAGYEELMAQAGLDWVLIGSPNLFHRSHIEAALARGLHVFTEKPIATTVEDCLDLAVLARGSDRTLMTGLTLRYSPLYRRVKQLLTAGRIGRIISIDANENLFPGHGAYIMTNWRRDYTLAGAHILEKCVHDLDLLNWFTDSLPVKVAAFGGNDLFVPAEKDLFKRSPRFSDWEATVESGLNPFTTEKTIEDNIVTILEYANGTRAQFQLTSSNPLAERRMYFSGTEGNLVVDLVAGTLKLKTIFDPQVTLWEGDEGKDSHGGGDEVMIDELVNTMIRGTSPATGIDEGLKGTLVGISLDRARREGRVVDLTDLWRSLEPAQ